MTSSKSSDATTYLPLPNALETEIAAAERITRRALEAYRHVLTRIERHQIDLRVCRQWLREAEKALAAAIAAGRPVDDGLVCRIDQVQKEMEIDWRMVAFELLGEEDAKEAWSRIKKQLKEQPRFREKEQVLFSEADAESVAA